MALYTPPPSLPRTPPMLPSELIAMWQKVEPPLTPPMSTTFEHRRRPLSQVQPPTTLPPITHFDRHLPNTPPQLEHAYPRSPPASYKLPPMEVVPAEMPFATSEEPFFVDWLDVTRKRSAYSIAEKTCEMICYLWFSPPSSARRNKASLSPTPATTTLQLVATPVFVQFMQKLLETTQVSQSVIVLSLHYIYRLKERNDLTDGLQGSEFRIAVGGLMMANKFLDDNTYTNKTWSEVSGIQLPEINKMEREFLMGVDFDLYVSKTTYDSWMNLLKGLIMAKERDSRHWRRSRHHLRLPRPPANHLAPVGSQSRYLQQPRTRHRARSTSPNASCVLPYPQHYNPRPQPSRSPLNLTTNLPAHSTAGAKRSAEDAFSPPTAFFSHMPAKRPVSMSLVIPEFTAGRRGSEGSDGSANSYSHSPLESFAKMSIQGSSPYAVRNNHTVTPPRRESNETSTLVSAYNVDERTRNVVPQNLYFYTLAGSPLESEERTRKTRLCYHQPTNSSSSTSTYHAPPPQRPIIPSYIHSAAASPRHHHLDVPRHAVLPHFNDIVWTTRPQSNGPSYLAYGVNSNAIPAGDRWVPAPFANAGPPGVHSYHSYAHHPSFHHHSHGPGPADRQLY